MFRVGYRTVGGTLAVVVGVGLFTAVAFATHNEPKAAKAIKGNVVTAYEKCTAPDTTTDPAAGSKPACSTPVRSDPTCGFTTIEGLPKGKGQLQIASRDENGWSVKLKFLGLEPQCDGETLDFVVTIRNTAHSCVGLPCTAVDRAVVLSSCTVERGTCKINVPVLPLPDVLAAGGTELFAFSVIHQENGNRAFEIGILTRYLF